ncbi:LEA type 2 family protein [Marinimicrobium sp. ABcell2]|uniref:LEA type 2 family protein n=1 Tax=Marinimicrobium sp. ABcell2 TaxID=3069751 RepID=UPI0027B04FD1|nr:LEA type 2 family protein [Marinimicrobium sp. ABcell2]MDQ2076497.1 LEA type 2 family protein [Marinimicrobium sp. ABcell2]
MHKFLSRFTVLLVVLSGLNGCAMYPWALQEPQVKVTHVQLLPPQGLEQRIAVRLAIINPNSRDLSLRGISYTIGIENFDLLSGATSQLPVLKAYEETPVTVEVSANLLAIVRLVEHLSRRGTLDDVGYVFQAKLDFSQWLPDMRIEEAGTINLRY